MPLRNSANSARPRERPSDGAPSAQLKEEPQSPWVRMTTGTQSGTARSRRYAPLLPPRCVCPSWLRLPAG